MQRKNSVLEYSQTLLSCQTRLSPRECPGWISRHVFYLDMLIK